MIIEKLQKKDIKIYKELIDSVFDGSNDISKHEKYNESSNYEIIVAKSDNKIVGSITFVKLELFTFSFQPVLELFNVSVLKEYRGEKIAKQIFEYIINYAKINEYKSICLTCLETAYDAHKLYESMGMTKTSSVKYNMYL